MIVCQNTDEKDPSIVSVPQIRLIELITIFCIIYISKEIAGFVFHTGYIVALFLGSAFLNLAVTMAENLCLRRSGFTTKLKYVWEGISVFIDLSTVLVLIYLTGTTGSPFIFLVVVPLFFAGRLLPVIPAGITITFITLSTILILGALEIKGVIPRFSCYSPERSALNPHYIMGTVLVLGGFMSLMTFLFSTFYENFNVYFKTAEDRILNSRRRILELTRLYDISLGINSVISLDTLLKMVCKEITLLLRRPWASVLLLNQKQKVVKQVELGERGVVSIEPEGDIDNDTLLAKILDNENALTVDNVNLDKCAPVSLLVAGRNLSTFMAVPMLSGSDTLGVLMVGDDSPEPYSPEDIRLLTILAGQVTTAIEKSRLYEVMSGRVSRLETENEKLKNANKLKMSYISHLSHELKTPLTSIKAYVESICGHLDNPDFKERDEFLDIISNETDRLIRMVNKVLDISKIEFGQRSLRRRLLELSPLIDDIESSMQPYLKDKDLRLIVKLPANLPLIDGDDDLIKQVLINLVGNAIKFSPRGSRIFIEAVEDSVSVKISVRDEGVGIPEQDIKNIFKQFYQVSSGMEEGVGLGLAIVRNIIEQHGGYIHVTSKIGEGSMFSFTLPKEHHFNDLLGYLFDSMDARDEVQEMFDLSVKVVAEMLSVKIVSLMLLDRERKELFIKNAYGLDERIVSSTRVKIGEGIAGKVAESGEPLLIENVEESGYKNKSNYSQYETKSFLSVPLMVNSAVIGVINANNRTDGKSFGPVDLALLESLSQRMSKVIERMRTAEDSYAFLDETIQSLRSLLASCDQMTAGYNRQLVNWSVDVARKLRLNEKEIQVIQYVSGVHDVGMTCVGDNILRKTLDLTTEEIEEIRKHPQRGAAIMRPFEFIEMVSKNILFHHERMDGKGYPMGLKGEQIPIGSRIIAVLDAYVSMTGRRPYREKLTREDAVDELVKHAGTQFDPRVVAAFVEVLIDEGQIEVEEYKRIADSLRIGSKHHAMP